MLLEGKITVGEAELAITTIESPELDFSWEPSNRYLVDFKTPTFFRRKESDYRYLFPDPKVLFTSIARIWGRLSGEKINIENLRELAERKIGVLMHNIRTSRTIHLGKGRRVVGFTGRCVYEVNDEELANLVGKLLKIAEITNVGGSRTLGFGVIEWRPLK